MIRAPRVNKLGMTLGVFAVLVILFAPLPIEIHTRIYKSITIDRAPAAVFDYVTTPRNWPAWHPSSLGVSGAIERSAQPGERIEEAFVVAGFRGEIVWTVVVRAAPSRWVIDGKSSNGGGGRISYTLSTQGRGTRFEREFVYYAPNVLAVILDWLFVRERIDSESAEALRRLKVVLEG